MKRTLIALLATALLAGPPATWATGYKPPIVKPPVVVKPPIVVPPPVTPPVTVAPTPTPQPTPAPEQPVTGKGPGTVGWIVFGAVAVYFTAVVRSHMLFCAEDDKKPARQRKCYRPLRDGMPS